MSGATARDQIDFEALPEDVQALAKRVLSIEYEIAYDEGYEAGFDNGVGAGEKAERDRITAKQAVKP